MNEKRSVRILALIAAAFVLLQIFMVSDARLEGKKCPHCGEPVEEGSAFCPNCGKKIGEVIEKKALLNLEEMMKRARGSILSVSALHNRNIYDSWGEKTNIAYLLGTAFVIRKGYAITDLSVIEHAKEIRLLNAEGKIIGCSLQGKDRLFGIAVLKLDDQEIAPLPMADSSMVKVGDEAYAIGFPATKGEAKVGVAVGKGIISALARSGIGLRQYENFFQTDSSFTDGMNGAPLLNRNGELIGLTAMLLSHYGLYVKHASTVGFASPINEIKEIAWQLIDERTRERGWMGIILDELKNHPDKEVRKSGKGLYVRFVEAGSPAEKASVSRGDIILTLDGDEISEIHAFQRKILESPPGKNVELKVKNSKGTSTYAITLMKRGDRIKLSHQDRVFYLVGLRFRENEKGRLIVQEVEPDSRAYVRDIKVGYTLDDILVKKDYRSEIDDFAYYNVRSMEDFEKAVDKGYSDYEFWVQLRFKEKNESGFQIKLQVWGSLIELPSA